ncbi:hypothetical protein B0T16DRAFT_487004 [Cercophora newfieldiana]|uniref:F-box domain-containing protein n=1 Tax=Cercophora newfieldiana TaxID=92897 RepID=A0AA39YMV0_9PEZI|nr:hypothetical protein B0T16DRAFT_487004 [Cercophora newfieldiana]
MIIKLLSLNPDTAWTGRTRREGPSSDTDPLVADAFYNAKYSHLCRLPDTVLLRIMERLDPIGLQCLRRTSRLFLRLFGDDRFSHYHHDDDDDDLTRQGCADHTGPGPPVFFPWVRSRRVLECRYPQTPGTRPLGQLLQQDIRICATCRENREARQAWHRALCIKRTSDTALRRCAPCDVHHPPAYFSRLRRCLGRLGHVRLCEHDGCVITWDTALKYGKQLVKCDLPEPARVRLLVCRDKSHLPTRHLHQQQAADGDEAGYYPSITITGSKSTAIRLCMEWTGCLPLRLATRDEEDEKSLVTPGEMARLLKRFRHGSPAEFIVPQSTLGSLPEMRCFDPNRCRCLHYAGKDDTPKGWLLGPRQRRSQNQACRFSSDSDGKLGVAMVSGTHTSRCTIGRDSEMRIDIGPSTTHAASARGRLPLCLGITYRRSILVAAKGDECRAVTQSWYEAIDSRSYAGVALDGNTMHPSPRSAVMLVATLAAALVVLFLLVAGTSALPHPTGVRPLRPVPTNTTKPVTDLKKAALALERALADWSKALKGVSDSEPWKPTSGTRAAAKKIANACSWIDEEILVGVLVAIGTVAAVVGPGRLLLAGTRVLGAGSLWVRVAWRRFSVRVLRAWWRKGVWELLGKMSMSVRWKRYGPARTLNEWGVVSRAWLEEWAAYTYTYKPEKRIPGVFGEWLRTWDNYLDRAARV